MQLLVIVLTIPWLIVLSRTSWYRVVRMTGAIFASLAWIIERLTEKVNTLTTLVEHIAELAPWLFLLLAWTSMVSLFWRPQSKKSSF